MLVTVTAFGSVWERRLGRTANGDVSFSRAAYYNTTGVSIDGRIHYRWTIGGKIRFNSAGGFDADCPSRSVNRVFECGDWRIRSGGWKELLFRRMLEQPVTPDYYLIVVTPGRNGRIDTRSDCWKAMSVEVIAASERRGEQETMLLMPAWSWVRTELGTWFAEPARNKCRIGALRLGNTE